MSCDQGTMWIIILGTSAFWNLAWYFTKREHDKHIAGLRAARDTLSERVRLLEAELGR